MNNSTKNISFLISLIFTTHLGLDNKRLCNTVTIDSVGLTCVTIIYDYTVYLKNVCYCWALVRYK